LTRFAKTPRKDLWPNRNATSGQTESDFAAKGRPGDPASDLSAEEENSELDRKGRPRVTSLQRQTMVNYKKLGLSVTEISRIMAVPRGVVYYYTKSVPPLTESGHVPTTSMSPSDLPTERIAGLPLPDSRTYVTVEQNRPNTNTTENGIANSATGSANGQQAHDGDGSMAERQNAGQTISVDMGSLKFKWSPRMIWLIGSLMFDSGYDQPDVWFEEWLTPRLRTFKLIEEYIDFKNLDDFMGKFTSHMNNSLNYLKALQALKEERLHAFLTGQPQ